MKPNKSDLKIDNEMVIHQIKLKYGDEPIFSSKYESVKKSYLERKLLNK